MSTKKRRYFCRRRGASEKMRWKRKKPSLSLSPLMFVLPPPLVTLRWCDPQEMKEEEDAKTKRTMTHGETEKKKREEEEASIL